MLLFNETNQAGRWTPKQREFGAAAEELGKSKICRRADLRLQAAFCRHDDALVLINCRDVSIHCEFLRPVFCVFDLSKRLSKHVSAQYDGLISACSAVFKRV